MARAYGTGGISGTSYGTTGIGYGQNELTVLCRCTPPNTSAHDVIARWNVVGDSVFLLRSGYTSTTIGAWVTFGGSFDRSTMTTTFAGETFAFGLRAEVNGPGGSYIDVIKNTSTARKTFAPSVGATIGNADTRNLRVGTSDKLAYGFGGPIWDVAIWHRALSDDELRAYSEGYSPLLFADGLAFYAPFQRDTRDIVGQRDSVLDDSTYGGERAYRFPSRPVYTMVSAVPPPPTAIFRRTNPFQNRIGTRMPV